MANSPSGRDERPLLTVAEFADRFRIARSTAYLLVTTGEVKTLRVGRRQIRITAAEADAFEQRAVDAAAAAEVPA